MESRAVSRKEGGAVIKEEVPATESQVLAWDAGELRLLTEYNHGQSKSAPGPRPTTVDRVSRVDTAKTLEHQYCPARFTGISGSDKESNRQKQRPTKSQSRGRVDDKESNPGPERKIKESKVLTALTIDALSWCTWRKSGECWGT